MASELPSPPFANIPGIANLRDIGPTTDDLHRGLVYRSAFPSQATPEALTKLSELGIKTIFDLRSTSEIQRDGPEWAGVAVDRTDVFDQYGITRAWVPVFAAQDYSPEQVALRYKKYTQVGTEGFVSAYRDILQAAPPAYGKILRHLAGSTADDGSTKATAEPFLICCTAGKDRTGVLAALILLLAGVPKNKVAEEYALTDQGLASLRPLFVERLLKNPVMGGDREAVLNMISSKAANMQATIEMIDEEFGGAEKYVREKCGLSADEVESLRKNLKKH